MAGAVLFNFRPIKYGRFPPFGNGYIAGESPDGLLTIESVPAARPIEVRHRRSGRVIASTWSATDGTYVVHFLDTLDEFDVIARDPLRQWKDVIEPAVIPEPY